MSILDDLTIPLSRLWTFETADSMASCNRRGIGTRDPGWCAAPIRRRASCKRSVLNQGDDVHSVSVTFDVSSDAATAGEKIDFESRIDRKTRTLIFRKWNCESKRPPLA